jgi:hypothetical protein
MPKSIIVEPAAAHNGAPLFERLRVVIGNGYFIPVIPSPLPVLFPHGIYVGGDRERLLHLRELRVRVPPRPSGRVA